MHSVRLTRRPPDGSRGQSRGENDSGARDRRGTYGPEVRRTETIALSRPGSRSGFSFELGPRLRNLGAIRALSSPAAPGSGARRGRGARGGRLGHSRARLRPLAPPARPPAREQSASTAPGGLRPPRPAPGPAAAPLARGRRAPAAARSPECLTGLRGPRPARSASASCPPPPPPLRHLPPARRPSRSAPPRGAGRRRGAGAPRGAGSVEGLSQPQPPSPPWGSRGP